MNHHSLMPNSYDLVGNTLKFMVLPGLFSDHLVLLLLFLLLLLLLLLLLVFFWPKQQLPCLVGGVALDN